MYSTAYILVTPGMSLPASLQSVSITEKALRNKHTGEVTRGMITHLSGLSKDLYAFLATLPFFWMSHAPMSGTWTLMSAVETPDGKYDLVPK